VTLKEKIVFLERFGSHINYCNLNKIKIGFIDAIKRS